MGKETMQTKPIEKVLVIHPPFGFSPNDVSEYYSQAFKRVAPKTYDFYLNRHMVYHSLAFDSLVQVGQLKQSASLEEVMKVVQLELFGMLFKLKPDMVFMVHGFYSDDTVLGELRELCDYVGARFVLLTTESPHNKAEEIRASKHFTDVFSTDLTAQEYLSDAKYLGHAYFPPVHNIVPVYDIPEEYKVDIGFVGAFFPERLQIFSTLIREGFTTFLSGLVNDAYVDDDVIQYIRGELVENADLARLYNGADFSVNFTRRSEYLEGTEVDGHQKSMTIRMIECMAAGGVLVTDETEELQDLCEEGIHYIGFSDTHELLDKIRYYSMNKDLLPAIRQNAYRHIRTIKPSYIDNARAILDHLHT